MLLLCLFASIGILFFMEIVFEVVELRKLVSLNVR